MATATKQNGIATKKETTTTKKEVQQKLTQQAQGKTLSKSAVKEISKANAVKPLINLDERINRFEKLKGIASQRERLVGTLSNLTRFNYNSSESCSFYLKDASGMEFKTTNSNLITLVASTLQETLEKRKAELEKELLEFEL